MFRYVTQASSVLRKVLLIGPMNKDSGSSSISQSDTTRDCSTHSSLDDGELAPGDTRSRGGRLDELQAKVVVQSASTQWLCSIVVCNPCKMLHTHT